MFYERKFSVYWLKNELQTEKKICGAEEKSTKENNEKHFFF